jgi:hypothetical protein
MIFGIELSKNSKFRVKMKWLTIQILLFGWLEFAVEIIERYLFLILVWM